MTLPRRATSSRRAHSAHTAFSRRLKRLKMLGLYHESCNMLSILNVLTMHEELQNVGQKSKNPTTTTTK